MRCSLKLQNIQQNDKILIGTDSNTSEKSSSRRIRSFKKFKEKFSLLEVSGNLPTFHHNNGISHSLIDTFLFSEFTKSCHLDFHSHPYQTPTNSSAHDPIIGTIKISCSDKNSQKEKDFTHTYTNFEKSPIIWDPELFVGYHNLVGPSLKKTLEQFNTPEDLPNLSVLFSNLLVKSAEIVYEKKEKKTKTNKYKPPPLLKLAIDKLNKAHKLWTKAGRPTNRTHPAKDALCHARSELQHTRRTHDKETSISNHNLLMEAKASDCSKIYKLMKKFNGRKRDSTTPMVITPLGTYTGSNVLEGFSADAELLGKIKEDVSGFDNKFYNLCVEDNLLIFEFNSDNPISIPPMTRKTFDNIINNKMKLGKACDAYQLCIEHLRYCGPVAQDAILQLVNRFINNIHYLSCQQIKVGLATNVHKGKGKPINKANSYRRVTVTPHIGVILDRYLDPPTEQILRPSQSPDQYGFTKGMSYLLGSLQRGECQRHALDQNKTCFGASFDGEAAFPSVDRQIQIREQYELGERGDILEYSKNTYTNTECQFKLDGKLGRTFREERGNRQGHVKAAGHFKGYINPCLTAVDKSKLGFMFGNNIHVGGSCVADDTYVTSDTPEGLQGLIDIVAHWGRRYRMVFGPSKMRITVTGPSCDMQLFKDTEPWVIAGKTIPVAIDNDHLGLIVSGDDEDEKNVEEKLRKGRNSLFALLGPAFAYKCLLSPSLQCHLWRTYTSSVIRSGLCALPLRHNQTQPLTAFHRKLLRGFLKLSNSSPIPALHFLLGELPLEGRLHLDVLSLFWSVWSNPDSTTYKILKYLLTMSPDNSRTWSIHVRHICRIYGMKDPLVLLQENAWSQATWKAYTNTLVTSHHEKKLRQDASTNSKMSLLNISLSGLTGKAHYVMEDVFSADDVSKLRIHVKMLCQDYLTHGTLAKQSADRGVHTVSGHCRACSGEWEDIRHILTECEATSGARDSLFPKIIDILSDAEPGLNWLNLQEDKANLAQFLVDPASMSLPTQYRLPLNHPQLTHLVKILRELCFRSHKLRAKALRASKV